MIGLRRPDAGHAGTGKGEAAVQKAFRVFLVMMILLVVLGAWLLFSGAGEHMRRPVAPVVPHGSAHVAPMPDREGLHV